MPQLELGYLPLRSPATLGMPVAFVLNRRISRGKKGREKIVAIGRIVCILDDRVIIEDMSSPGSKHNRAVDSLFEVHTVPSLEKWSV